MLERLGVEMRYGQRAGVDVTVEGLRAEGYAAILVAVGAQRGKRLGLPGEDAAGVLDGVDFLRGVREGRPAAIGPRVGVIGAGDTAMDCARSARRVGATSVQVIYRRTVDQMPADREEIHELHEEDIEVLELARPVGLRVADGRLTGLTCLRTEYGGARDAAGRKTPQDVPGSEFEVGLDTLILAISQAPVLDLFGDRAAPADAAGLPGHRPGDAPDVRGGRLRCRRRLRPWTRLDRARCGGWEAGGASHRHLAGRGGEHAGDLRSVSRGPGTGRPRPDRAAGPPRVPRPGAHVRTGSARRLRGDRPGLHGR